MVLVVLVVLIAVALLVALHLGAACLFANRTDAQADLLLFLVHLDDLELMLRVDFELHRNVVLVHRLGDMAEPFHAFGNLHKRAELGGPQDLAFDDIADAVLCEKGVPDVRLETCTRPSMPSSISMKAPKSVRLRTRPSMMAPIGYFSSSCSQGLSCSCFMPSEMRRSFGLTLRMIVSTSSPGLTSFDGCFIRLDQVISDTIILSV